MSSSGDAEAARLFTFAVLFAFAVLFTFAVLFAIDSIARARLAGIDGPVWLLCMLSFVRGVLSL